MNKRELMKEIDVAFKEAGKYDDWVYDQYKEYYQRGQLENFQIFEINWFPGAARILTLVDQLHTLVTPKEDFMAIAKLLGENVNSRMTKKRLAEIVKAYSSWRSKSFELDKIRRLDLRKRSLQPLYDHLASLGYRTELMPVKVSFGKWMIDATDVSGNPDTIYLNESPAGDTLLIQSVRNNVTSVFEGTELFIQRV